ncbi:YhgN family NAAT transporter [Ferrimonas marina]|uniref:UPF0056 membrane protein n=1 Tax=Ferrimonas marina TaxID=299255 RepID=A0A1M5XP18_9GAMM|nr:YhgN family NAAT transporter [Ferrimonas marina]SHI01402.1 multiple antibiotic resistance protein [Ferrimonas marina]
METITAAVMLLFIMDPLGNLPIFSSVLRHVAPSRRRFILIRELLIALLIMLVFLYAGEAFLNFLNLSSQAVSISGAIILFIIGLRMIFPDKGSVTGLDAGEEPLIVPLAVPLLAGPSVLATLILLAHQDPNRMVDWTLATVGAWAITAATLMLSGVFLRVLGERGLKAIERLMGMILLMLSVQMFLDGIAGLIGN